MKLAVDKKYIDLDNVECELENIRCLLVLHNDYFSLGEEIIKKEPWRLTLRYSEQSALVNAIIDVVDNALELLNIVQENQQALTSPAGTAAPTN